jgi:hypothetical protein
VACHWPAVRCFTKTWLRTTGVASATPSADRTAAVTSGASPEGAATTKSATTPLSAWSSAAAATVVWAKICTDAIVTASTSGVTATASRRALAVTFATAR